MKYSFCKFMLPILQLFNGTMMSTCPIYSWKQMIFGSMLNLHSWSRSVLEVGRGDGGEQG